VGVLMRVRNDNDVELSRLPGDFVRRYQQGGLVVLVYEQSPP
jgi:hypothetical protein